MKVDIEVMRSMVGHGDKATAMRNRFARELAKEENITNSHKLGERMRELAGVAPGHSSCQKIVEGLRSHVAAKSTTPDQVTARRLTDAIELLEAQSLEIKAIREEVCRIADALGAPKAEVNHV